MAGGHEHTLQLNMRVRMSMSKKPIKYIINSTNTFNVIPFFNYVKRVYFQERFNCFGPDKHVVLEPAEFHCVNLTVHHLLCSEEKKTLLAAIFSSFQLIYALKA